MWVGVLSVQLEPVRSARSVGIVQNCADTQTTTQSVTFFVILPTRWAKGAACAAVQIYISALAATVLSPSPTAALAEGVPSRSLSLALSLYIFQYIKRLR